jgi:hypothetical protein
MAMAFQTLGPLLQPLVGAGVVGPMNALIDAWAKANDLDATPFLIPPPPPPPPVPGPPPPDGVEGGGEAPTNPEEPPNGPPV